MNIPNKVKLVTNGTTHGTKVLDAETGELVGCEVLADVYYQTPRKPWQTPPVINHRPDGTVFEVVKEGVPEPPETSAVVELCLPGGARVPVPAELEVAPGTKPFRFCTCRLSPA